MRCRIVSEPYQAALPSMSKSSKLSSTGAGALGIAAMATGTEFCDSIGESVEYSTGGKASIFRFLVFGSSTATPARWEIDITGNDCGLVWSSWGGESGTIMSDEQEWDGDDVGDDDDSANSAAESSVAVDTQSGIALKMDSGSGSRKTLKTSMSQSATRDSIIDLQPWHQVSVDQAQLICRLSVSTIRTRRLTPSESRVGAPPRTTVAFQSNGRTPLQWQACGVACSVRCVDVCLDVCFQNRTDLRHFPIFSNRGF